jgi:hypothetical protein
LLLGLLRLELLRLELLRHLLRPMRHQLHELLPALQQLLHRQLLPAVHGLLCRQLLHGNRMCPHPTKRRVWRGIRRTDVCATGTRPKRCSRNSAGYRARCAAPLTGDVGIVL